MSSVPQQKSLLQRLQSQGKLRGKAVVSRLDDSEVVDFRRTVEARGFSGDDFVDALDAGADGLVAQVIAGSPFLAGIIRRRPELLLDLLQSDPHVRMQSILTGLADEQAAAEPTASAFKTVAQSARRAKEEAALLIALADLSGVFSLKDVTGALSGLADCALQIATRHLFRTAVAKGLWEASPDDAKPDVGSGYFVLAMGKHGAHELNYSSDIDLIVLYDLSRCRHTNPSEVQTFFVRLTQEIVRFMGQRTADGYVFRTDLRLRPDPGATQIALSTDAAAHYYESFGQNWERAAMIKARPVAGDLEAGEEFCRSLAPFIWRKYLDFAAIADIHAMKRQIHAHRGFSHIAVAGHDIKVGRGGIREIEFFAQTQQLIAGGRQAELRVPQTLLTLKALADRDWITAEACDELTKAYEFLRTIEHRIQMVGDEQTQKLPSDHDSLERLARFSGFGTLPEFEAAVLEQLQCVEKHYATLFEDVPELTTGHSNLVFAGEDDDPATFETLSKMGFVEPARVSAIVRAWHRGRYRATATKVARERLTELTPVLLEAFSKTVDPDAALLGFDRMLGQLPAGVQMFALLHANPGLLRLIADITGSAPRLAQVLARRRRVIDALLDPRVMGEALPDRDALNVVVAEQLKAAASFEDALDQARVIFGEQAFLIGVRILARTIGAGQAGLGYADLAEVLIDQLHLSVQSDFEQSAGSVAGGACAVLAMGKLGGREMTAASDLDLIVVYDNDAEARQSEGGTRSLSIQQYFARLTQRLITALSAPTAQGALFEVDMRLRPSGQKGPVATQFESFKRYQQQEAWTWEHMALTRARIVSGPPELRARIEDTIREILCSCRDRAQIASDVRDMRARIADEKGTDDIWDLKQVRGGLVDLEFIAQFLQLVHAHAHPTVLSQNTRDALVRLDRAGLLEAEGESLIAACDLLHELTQILRLCFDGVFAPEKAPDGLKQLLADTANLPDFETLEAHLSQVQREVHRLFDYFIPVATETADAGR